MPAFSIVCVSVIIETFPMSPVLSFRVLLQVLRRQQKYFSNKLIVMKKSNT